MCTRQPKSKIERLAAEETGARRWKGERRKRDANIPSTESAHRLANRHDSSGYFEQAC
jgi:hypothetical protein